MGGKDSPPPFAQQPQQQLEQDHKMAEIHSLERSYCTLSLPRSTASTPSLSLRRESSPIQYVPKSKSAVNVQRHGSSSTLDGSGSSTLPRSYTSSGSGSPVRTYMECLSPQSLKVVLVGDSCVGKTSMLMSYTVEKFIEKHSPTIYDSSKLLHLTSANHSACLFSITSATTKSYVVDLFSFFTIASLAVNGRRISLTLCDTSGSDDFGHLRPLCYPQADVAIICFSTVDHTTLDSVKSKWIKEIRRNCPGVPILLVGTKIDRSSQSRWKEDGQQDST